jgi:quercetin dioxygenase-like cupin family protein
MKIHRLLVPLAALCLASAQTAPQAVDVSAEPHHHLVLENRYVRAFRVEVPPNGATGLHRHANDYVFVVLGASRVSNEVQGKLPVTLQLADGEAGYTEGGFAHVARNLASTPFRNVTVEILPAAKQRAAARKPGAGWERGVELFEGGSVDTIVVRGGLRVTETELKPGATLAQHRHAGPHLAIAISDLELRSEAPGKPAQTLRRKSGETDWITGGVTHALTNVGSSPARFLAIEFR